MPLSGRRRVLLALAALLIATAVWLPALHLLFRRDVGHYYVPSDVPGRHVPPHALALAMRHMRLWMDTELRDEEIGKMRVRNAEWDFMGRSFLVWSLTNMALREPDAKEAALVVIDRIIEETLRLERERDHYHFLLPYAQDMPFVEQPARSLFVDGEIALMLGCRRILEEKEEYRPLLAERIDLIIERMEQSPVLSAESYPDECWTFCNTVALAAIKVADHLDGTDHSEFCRRWIETAKERLVDPETGMLVSSYSTIGTHRDGPEGSTIWLVAHMLQVVDEEFATDQYLRAREALARNVLGFGYSREWPPSWQGPQDVDSGPVIPVLGISASASGLAFVGAASFGDAELISSLGTSLRFGGFPIAEGEGLRYAASNQVGDAVLLYAGVLGPVWDRVMAGGTP